jgi:1-phosphofructokinase
MTDVVTVTVNPALDQTVRVADLALGRVNRAESLAFSPGGKGVNVAGCLADYGIATIATGLLGADDAASFEALFAAKHIGDRFVRIAGRTRINVKLVDTANDETTDINLAAAPPGGTDLSTLEACIVGLAKPGRWFVLAGSLPENVSPAFYQQLTHTLRKAGARVALDTSEAPLAASLSTDDPDALPNLIKPNRAELEALVGRVLPDDAAVLGAACTLAARGIGYVAVSLGERGALGVTRAAGGADSHNEAKTGAASRAPGQSAPSARAPSATGYWGFRATPPEVPVASTVGAGDAFVAGLVASLIEGRAWDDCGRRASAFAAAKLVRVGPHLPERAALDALAAKVKVETFALPEIAEYGVQR